MDHCIDNDGKLVVTILTIFPGSTIVSWESHRQEVITATNNTKLNRDEGAYRGGRHRGEDDRPSMADRKKADALLSIMYAENQPQQMELFSTRGCE